ncbi:hypothetical protein LO82_19770 [Vibrio vulnificus]|nr:hypothetical protein LO82_19770 [Vibrio vulnificus]
MFVAPIAVLQNVWKAGSKLATKTPDNLPYPHYETDILLALLHPNKIGIRGSVTQTTGSYRWAASE